MTRRGEARQLRRQILQQPRIVADFIGCAGESDASAIEHEGVVGNAQGEVAFLLAENYGDKATAELKRLLESLIDSAT